MFIIVFFVNNEEIWLLFNHYLSWFCIGSSNIFRVTTATKMGARVKTDQRWAPLGFRTEKTYLKNINVGNCIKYKWKDDFPRKPNNLVLRIFDDTDRPPSKDNPIIIKNHIVVTSSNHVSRVQIYKVQRLIPKIKLKKFSTVQSIRKSTTHTTLVSFPLSTVLCSDLISFFFNNSAVYIPPRAPNKNSGNRTSGQDRQLKHPPLHWMLILYWIGSFKI